MISLFKFPAAMVIRFFFLVSTIIFAVRKFAYELYVWFPNAHRIYEFLGKREPTFYWVNRTDFSIVQLLRLYTLWIMLRFDKYVPIIDCERQATKAQYFHDEGRYTSMRGWHFRRIDPKAWPVLFLRNFAVFLFPSLSGQQDQIINNPETQPASHKAYEELP